MKRISDKEELEEEGFDVECVCSRRPSSGLNLRGDHLILLDIRMTGMDGIEGLTEDQGEMDRVTRHAHVTIDYKQDFGRASDGYIVKSSDLSELKEMIREILERAEEALYHLILLDIHGILTLRMGQVIAESKE